MPWPFPHLAEWLRVIAADRRVVNGPIGPIETAERLDGLALAALEAAVELIGQGEEGGDNRGPFVEMLINPAKPPQNWCAGFVGFCYQRAALRMGVPLPFARSLGAKRLGRNVGAAGRIFTDPALAKPGDLMVFDRGAKGSWMGHVAMVEQVINYTADSDGAPLSSHVATVEGNSGPKVMRRLRRADRDRFAFFASVRRT
jgi:hypothetical protein